jgi:hypothetical protein
MEVNLVYATFFKVIKGPRAALWPRPLKTLNSALPFFPAATEIYQKFIKSFRTKMVNK